MKIRLFQLSLFFLFHFMNGQDFSQFVNPFIGTGGHGHTYPGASLPSGMMQLSPDTRLEGWDGCGGYHASDSIVYGFSHTHLSGTGVSDYGDVLIMPITGTVKVNNGYKLGVDEGYASRFNKKSEKASPGYYEVYLDDYKTKVQLATSFRSGIHEYHFETQDQKSVLIDLSHRDELVNFNIEQTDVNEIVGYRISKAWAEQQHLYFVAQFSESIDSTVYFINDRSGHNHESSKKITPKFTKAVLQFPSDLKNLKIRIGISAVSIEGARKNLASEINHWNLNQLRIEARNAWNKELQKIQIEAEDSIKEIFYTSLYHSLLNPNIFSDVDGNYRGTDLEIHHSDTTIYTVFSLWDTFRATHPLYTILDEKKTNDFIHTFLKQYQQGGKLPVWELAGNYTGCMIGYHSVSVVADAYSKGIKGFNEEEALKAMIHSSNMSHLGLPELKKYGYIPAELEHESVSKTLEYAYDDWCISQMALKMGKTNIAQEYLIRAQGYKNIFDPKTGFMRGKRNSVFMSPFNPTEVNFNFTEANSWQYSFFAPQDIQGLIKLQGGKDRFERKLDELFSTSNETSGRHQVDITGLLGQYAHGNEPSHHMAFLYNYIGKPWKTQALARKLLNEMYTTLPDGLIGNEDCGQMSSWYVFNSLGFYPVTPGSPYYTFGSPNIKKAILKLENGRLFMLDVINQSPENIYIQSVSFNGKEIKENYFHHDLFKQTGRMIITMGSQPNYSRGNEVHLSPPSNIDKFQIIPVPSFHASSQVFTDELEIEIVSPEPENKIHYTLDGSTPTSQSIEYTEKLVLDKASVITAICIAKNERTSKTAKTQIYKLDKSTKVKIANEYNPQYSAGGDIGLIDGLRGGEDFRTGAWQGFQGHDFEATVEYKEIKEIQYIGAGFIQDIRSWIWMPSEVIFETSMNGKDFMVAGKLKIDTPTDSYEVIQSDFGIDFIGQAKFIRVKAKQFGTIPEWHLGHDNPSFIFIDEIIVR